MGELNKDKAVGLLNRILEQELAGVVRYTHYSLLVFGFNRIPIVEWLREQATESLTHAQQAGEMITHLGAYPSLTIGPLLDTHRTDIGTILRELLASEGQALALYKELLLLVEGKSVMLRSTRGKWFRRRNYMPAMSIRCSANLARLPPSGLERLTQNEPSRQRCGSVTSRAVCGGARVVNCSDHAICMMPIAMRA